MLASIDLSTTHASRVPVEMTGAAIHQIGISLTRFQHNHRNDPVACRLLVSIVRRIHFS